MGVIDSLSAGYRFVTSRPYLLIIPILIDVILWMSPRLAIGPLLERLSVFYAEISQTEGLSGDFSTMTEQASTVLAELGQQTNILNQLASSSLLHVPSIMAVVEPLPGVIIREVGTIPNALLLFLICSVIGVFIGVAYIRLLARWLPIGAGEKHEEWPHFVQESIRCGFRVIVFVVAVILAVLAVVIPMSFLMTLVALVSPGLASLLLMLMSSLIFICFFYLYFATAGLILDQLTVFEAITRSVHLVRKKFWSAFGFIIMANLISLGFTLLLGPLATYAPAGTIVAIVGYAYIGTGLAMALLVFYRTQHLVMNGDATIEELLG